MKTNKHFLGELLSKSVSHGILLGDSEWVKSVWALNSTAFVVVLGLVAG